MQDTQNVNPKAAAFLARLYWMFFGNAIAYFLLAFIFTKNRALSFSVVDAAYWTTVASLVVVRYLDIRYLHGRTGGGDPSTLEHWRRYVGILVVTSLGMWLAAHTLGRFLE